MPKTKTSKFRPFEQARELIRGLGLANREEFFTWAKTSEKPADIPSSPVDVYSTQWKGWRDWLGDKKKEIKKPKQPKYRSFLEARELVVGLKFQSYSEFLSWVADEGANLRIPAHPQATYRGEWIDKDDWIGKESSKDRPPRFRGFDEARNFARSLGLETAKEWNQWANTDQRPKDIPKAPNHVYEEHWDRWGDWLGTDNVSTTRRKYKSFDEAREFARTLGLKTFKEWKVWSKTGNVPKDIPVAPAVVYSEDWGGWGDWLGSTRISNFDKEFLTFDEAREFVRKFNFKTAKEWKEYSSSGKRPDNIPSGPNIVYLEDWTSWGDWLGTNMISSNNRSYLNFLDARTFVRKLKLKSYKDWQIYSRESDFPLNIPKAPDHVYKTNGWNGWVDFLGARGGEIGFRRGHRKPNGLTDTLVQHRSVE
jgi:hypothetical protein